MGYALTYINRDDVELTESRDKVGDVENLIEIMDKEYGYQSYDDQEKRVAKIFPYLDISVNNKNQTFRMTIAKKPS